VIVKIYRDPTIVQFSIELHNNVISTYIFTACLPFPPQLQRQNTSKTNTNTNKSEQNKKKHMELPKKIIKIGSSSNKSQDIAMKWSRLT